MKNISVIIAILMGASFTLALPALIKDLIQDFAGRRDVLPSMLLKTLNISVSGTKPEPVNLRLPLDALVERDDPSTLTCDVMVDDGGMYSTNPEGVLYNLEQLRARTGKPPTVEPDNCELAICSSRSGIAWCVDQRYPHAYTLDNWGMLADAAQTMLDACGNLTTFDAAVVYDKTWVAFATACDK